MTGRRLRDRPEEGRDLGVRDGMRNLSDGLLGPSVSFTVRLGLFSAVAVSVVLVDLLVRGRNSTRWREYLVLVVGGAFGAAIGAGIDAVTSSISPDYFAHGKGLGAAPGLMLRSVLLGARAGFCAGAVVTGLLLVAAGPLTSLRWHSVAGIASALGSVGAWSLATAAVCFLLSWRDVRSPPAAPEMRFVLVGWTHAGAYLGAAVRAVLLAWRMARRRAAPGRVTTPCE